MSKKEKKEGINIRSYLALAVVCLIVIGVAWLAIQAQKAKLTAEPVPTTAKSDTAPRRSSALAILKEDGLDLMSLEGNGLGEVKWPDGVSRLGMPVSQMRGVDVGDGSAVLLKAGFVKASSTIFRSPDGRREAYVAGDKRDGTGAIEIVQGNEKATMVLRQSNGRKITDETLLGWLDKDTLVFTGIATSTKVFFTLGLNGTLKILANYPDEAWLVRLGDGAIYFTKATPGEGIESPQQAPSSIWKIAGNNPELVLEEPNHVIQDFQVGKNILAYSLEDGRLKALRDNKTEDFGQGRAVARFGDGVLCAVGDGFGILEQQGAMRRLDWLKSPASVFYLPSVTLD